MKKWLALVLVAAGALMCWVVYMGIATGDVALKGGGDVSAGSEPISFWVVTSIRALVPVTLFCVVVVLLRRK